MTVMVTELYDALKEASVSEERARAAAEVVANYDRQFAEIRGDLATLKGDVHGLRTVQTVIVWVLGLNFAATLAILAKISLHG